jgi:D-alanyl-D-alanine carboxypeptidase
MRYPASLTKMMTLYILFEAMEQGSVKKTDMIPISQRAERQPPSRLGIRAGDSISVDDAIRSRVTRSANDVALAVAEFMEGSESRFAVRMTAKARALGMFDTRYVNASGLPDTMQRTTARDLLTLSQSLFRDFPQYYPYFGTSSFTWRNVVSKNHNSLLGRVYGVDGIKTGYTRMSGFNLASSVTRDGHRVFAVVMGGETAAVRDAQMESLIQTAFDRIDHRNGAPDALYTRLPITRATVPTPAPAPQGQSVTPAYVGSAATAYRLSRPAAPVDAQTAVADTPSYVVPYPTYGARGTAYNQKNPAATHEGQGDAP